MQTDVTAMPAQRLVALLQALPGASPEATRALGLLQPWDGAMRADSAAAALYEVWMMEALRPAVWPRAPERA